MGNLPTSPRINKFGLYGGLGSLATEAAPEPA